MKKLKLVLVLGLVFGLLDGIGGTGANAQRYGERYAVPPNYACRVGCGSQYERCLETARFRSQASYATCRVNLHVCEYRCGR